MLCHEIPQCKALALLKSAAGVRVKVLEFTPPSDNLSMLLNQCNGSPLSYKGGLGGIF